MFYASKRFSVIDNMVKSEDNISWGMVNESLFIDSDTILTEALTDVYRSTYYGMIDNNSVIITEGFKDWVNKVVEFFKKMMDSFVNFIKKTIGYLQSYLGDFEKFCEKYEKNLSSFKPFNENIFTFTIKTGKVDTVGLDSVIDEYNRNLNKIKDMSKGDLHKMITDASKREVMDNIRGKITGSNTPVSIDNFKDALFKSYRDGKLSTTSTNIDSSKVSSMMHEYKEFKDLIKSVEGEADDIRSMFNDLITFFKNMPTYSYEDSDTKKITAYRLSKDKDVVSHTETGKEDHSDEYYRKLVSYYSFCSKHSKDIQHIYTTAFTAKTQAIKDAMSSHKNIIRKALNPFNSKEGAN